MNARDAEAMLALYADDAHVIWPGQGEEAKGRAEIKKLIDNNLKVMPADAKVIFKSQEAIALGKGYIATLGQWEQSFKGPRRKAADHPVSHQRDHQEAGKHDALRGRSCIGWVATCTSAGIEQSTNPIRPSMRDTSLRRALLAWVR